VVTPEIVTAALLVGLLTGLAGYFGWKQVLSLRGLRGSQEPREDRYYARNQALRRLFGCVLMVAAAFLVAGWFLFGLHEMTGQLQEQAQAAAAREEKPAMTQEQRRVLGVSSLYLILTLIVFFGLIVTAMLDVLAIRRYSRRHFQKLNDDRRAMIAHEAARMRSQRNGPG
jgi:hypothetical protein